MKTISKLNYLTINTDASFHPETKQSGYAYYVICDHFKFKKGGNFKVNKPRTSSEAEIMCLGNALAATLKNSLVKFDIIVINMDYLGAEQYIKKKNTVIAIKMREFLTSLEEITSAKIEFRHVKAHTNKKNARSRVNHWCDTEAKKYMRIDKIENNGEKEN